VNDLGPKRFYFPGWASDPFARGTYIYLIVYGCKAWAILAKPIDKTLFSPAKQPTSPATPVAVAGVLISGQ
jgi:hypothetical protein